MLFHKYGIGTLGNCCFTGQLCTEVSSAMMVKIRSYIHYIESCKIMNTAGFIHQYFQYCYPEDFCLGNGSGSEPQVTGKLRNIKHFNKESQTGNLLCVFRICI